MGRGGRAEPSQLGWRKLSDEQGAKHCVATTAGEDKSGRGIVGEAAPVRAGRGKTRDCAGR